MLDAPDSLPFKRYGFAVVTWTLTWVLAIQAGFGLFVLVTWGYLHPQGTGVAETRVVETNGLVGLAVVATLGVIVLAALIATIAVRAVLRHLDDPIPLSSALWSFATLIVFSPAALLVAMKLWFGYRWDYVSLSQGVPRPLTVALGLILLMLVLPPLIGRHMAIQFWRQKRFLEHADSAGW
jgi:hypothetical protein